jgi:hypothetical protein
VIRGRAATGVIVGCVTLLVCLAGAGEAAASAWRLRLTPNPVGATRSQLVGVSCPSRNFCLAVGYSSIRAGAFAALTERWDGRHWSILRSPRPPGAQVAVLSAISCASRRHCTAVGYFDNRVGVALPLAERWNGRGWSVQRPPLPASAAFGDLVGVSCASRTSCAAVGSFADTNGNQLGLAERWDGTRWSTQAAQDPPSAVAVDLKGISCTSPIACTAVGSLASPSGNSATLAERWDGTAWAIQSTADPSPTYGELVGVSCTSVGHCEAVGSYATASGPLRTLAERWDGSSWVVQPTANPRRSRTSQLFAVACRSALACTTVGNFANRAGAFGTLAERGKQNRWAMQRTARPPGATNSGFDAVACPSQNVCIAVGYFIDRAGDVLTLGEEYA